MTVGQYVAIVQFIFKWKVIINDNLIPSLSVWGNYYSIKCTKAIDWLPLLGQPFYLEVGNNSREKVSVCWAMTKAFKV